VQTAKCKVEEVIAVGSDSASLILGVWHLIQLAFGPRCRFEQTNPIILDIGSGTAIWRGNEPKRSQSVPMPGPSGPRFCGWGLRVGALSV